METPVETRDRGDILALLREAASRYRAGDGEGFAGGLREAEEAIETRTTREGAAATRSLRGELLLVTALGHLRDPERLSALYAQAEPLMDGRSQVLGPYDPFHQGASGVLGLVHRTPGTARRAADHLKRAVAIHHRLTGGGAGVDLLCEADLAYYSGDLQTGEVLAYRAIYAAHHEGQDVLLLDAAKLLAHLVKHRGDFRGWQVAVDLLNHEEGTKRPNEALCQEKRAGLLDELLLSLGDLSPGERTRTIPPLSLHPFHRFTTFWNHLLYLFYSSRHEQFLGASEAFLDLCGKEQIPLSEAYTLFFQGASLLALGRRDEARERVDRGCRTVVPDGLYLVAAETAPLLGDLVEEWLRRHDPSALKTVRRIREGLASHLGDLREAIRRGNIAEALSDRELAVARLAAEGLRNADIACRLSITEHTVKSHLKAVFSKLEVARRYELRERLTR